jgi:hypothetical protein
MIVTHRLEIRATCPVDQSPDVYQATITTRRLIPVESILAQIDTLTAEPIFQEELTLRLAAAIGAEVRTLGQHSGVTTEVVAGAGA